LTGQTEAVSGGKEEGEDVVVGPDQVRRETPPAPWAALWLLLGWLEGGEVARGLG